MADVCAVEELTVPGELEMCSAEPFVWAAGLLLAVIVDDDSGEWLVDLMRVFWN